MYESVVLAGLILQVLTLVTLGFFLLQLSTQQGRILLRLDSLEGKRAQPDDGTAASGPKGLAVGTAIADFELPDVAGKTRSLSEFRGRRLLLIYWSPDCGFCDMSAPELVEMQSALEANHTQLVLVSYGDAESNRKLAAEHALNCTILLLKDSTAEKYLSEEVFKYCGTPSAYLLDEQGQVAERLAAGMWCCGGRWSDRCCRSALSRGKPRMARNRRGPRFESLRSVKAASSVKVSRPALRRRISICRMSMANPFPSSSSAGRRCFWCSRTRSVGRVTSWHRSWYGCIASTAIMGLRSSWSDGAMPRRTKRKRHNTESLFHSSFRNVGNCLDNTEFSRRRWRFSSVRMASS